MRKKAVLIALGFVVLAAVAVGVHSDSAQTRRDVLWPGTLADELGSGNLLSTPQRNIREVAGAVQDQKLDDLIKDYAKRVASDPKSADEHFALGYAYFIRVMHDYKTPGLKSEYLERIEPELLEAIRLDAHLEEAYVTLGAYYVNQNPVKAVQFLTCYMEQNPEDAEAMYWIAMAYGSSGVVHDYTCDGPVVNDGRFCHDPDKMLEWLRKAAHASAQWLRPHLALKSQYIGRARQKTASGEVTYVDPWRTLAIEECKTILRSASPTRDAELINRVQSQMEQLTKQ